MAEQAEHKWQKLLSSLVTRNQYGINVVPRPETRECHKGKKGRAAEAKSNLPISSGAAQHLVDTQDVEGVSTDTEVEAILTAGLSEILVHSDTRGFERLRGQLLLLTTDQVAASRKLVNSGALLAEIEDLDLRL